MHTRWRFVYSCALTDSQLNESSTQPHFKNWGVHLPFFPVFTLLSFPRVYLSKGERRCADPGCNTVSMHSEAKTRPLMSGDKYSFLFVLMRVKKLKDDYELQGRGG